jgi:predicted NBD/HSP70 family sugar kinase
LKPVQERITNPKLKEIVHAVRRAGTLSKQELLERSKVTSSTLTRFLDELVSLKLLAEVGLGESTGGRKPILYEINPDYGYALGLDISRVRSRLVLTDLKHRVLASKEWPMTEEMTPDLLLGLVTDTASAMLHEHDIEQRDLLGLGVGAVGPLDREAGVILEPLYFTAPDWKDVEIKKRLEDALQVPVLLDNGANAALMGEYWNDKDNPQHLLYLLVGIGLRSAMMTNGRVVYGAVDTEGALGQMIIQADGIPHRLPGGNYGALESYVSVYSLEKQAQSYAKRGMEGLPPDWRENPDRISLADLDLANANGYPAAASIIEQAASYLGIGLANMLNTMHPDKIYLGGPLMSAFPTFYEKAVQTARERTMYDSRYPITFTRGHLGEAATAIGATILVINKLVEE